MTPPRILLVYANPAVTAQPVSPYGMERIGQTLTLAGCQVELIAPWIEPDPLAFLQEYLDQRPWDLVGLSVRNMDDALVVRSTEGRGAIDTTFYLDAIRPAVAAAVEAVGQERVLLGGPALSAGAWATLRYLGATRAIVGSAEDLVYWLGRALVRGEGPRLPEDPRVLVDDGAPWTHHRPEASPRIRRTPWRPPPGTTPRMGPYLGLLLARGGRVPVQLSSGCDRGCHFCVESRFLGQRVVPRPAEEVLAEIDTLARLGVRRLWLTASALNLGDEAHAIEVFRGLAGKGLDVQGFLQVHPVSDALLDAMEDAGLDPTRFSFELGHLDDTILRAGGGPARRVHIDALVSTWLRRGYDTLGGSVIFGAHLLETEATLERAVDAALEIDAALPAGLGLAYSAGARIYPNSTLADRVWASWDEVQGDLYTRTLDHGVVDPLDPTFTRPVVLSRPWAPRRLLAWLEEALAPARGSMGPMNAEAPIRPSKLAAESLVHRGIWRIHQGRPQEAVACLEEALEHDPSHLEALAQLAKLLGNILGDLPGAGRSLRRLLEALPAGDPRRQEVREALAELPEEVESQRQVGE